MREKKLMEEGKRIIIKIKIKKKEIKRNHEKEIEVKLKENEKWKKKKNEYFHSRVCNLKSRRIKPWSHHK